MLILNFFFSAGQYSKIIGLAKKAATAEKGTVHLDFSLTLMRHLLMLVDLLTTTFSASYADFHYEIKAERAHKLVFDPTTHKWKRVSHSHYFFFFKRFDFAHR